MQDQPSETTQDLKNALNTAREEARMRLHLFSLDARQKWSELEEKLFALENKLQSGAEGAASGLEAAAKKVRELTDATRQLINESGRGN
jgi:BMFP domain-containing protein YqiC